MAFYRIKLFFMKRLFKKIYITRENAKYLPMAILLLVVFILIFWIISYLVGLFEKREIENVYQYELCSKNISKCIEIYDYKIDNSCVSYWGKKSGVLCGDFYINK